MPSPRPGPPERIEAGPAPARIVISACEPVPDGGKYAAKAAVGMPLALSASVFTDGTDELLAAVRFGSGTAPQRWEEVALRPQGNDRWEAAITFSEMGEARFWVVAAIDYYGSWLRDLHARRQAGQEIGPEFEEGARIVERTAALHGGRGAMRKQAAALAAGLRGGDDDARLRLAAAPASLELMRSLGTRRDLVRSDKFRVWVERERATFSAWYELFPRSEGGLRGAEKRIPQIAKMGFDVLYLPPIHPIGVTDRKGKNNQLAAGPQDVGSPWAIGGTEGGHTAIHPDLGGIKDLRHFVATARESGLEVALDFAAQCSPDHPWVHEHPQWFRHRADGSIRFAENPPKRYQDIYPLDFSTDDWANLWMALRDVMCHWIDQGINIFRVDNPHTKPFAFWEWLIAEVRKQHPQTIFLAEAFTRPAVMQQLAKAGFSQSYTYFTWRNTKQELTGYLQELSSVPMAGYFRPNFWVNTPDILHEFLQSGGMAAFRLRAVLAAMAAPSWGMYSGYELGENQPLQPGSEEYLHSEKYEIRHRQWDRPDSLAPFIEQLNLIRRRHREAIANLPGLRVHHTDNDSLFCFSRQSAGGDTLLIVVNLDPAAPSEGTVWLDLGALGLSPDIPFGLTDALDSRTYRWQGYGNYVRLHPASAVAHIFELQR